MELLERQPQFDQVQINVAVLKTLVEARPKLDRRYAEFVRKLAGVDKEVRDHATIGLPDVAPPVEEEPAAAAAGEEPAKGAKRSLGGALDKQPSSLAPATPAQSGGQ